MLSSLPSLSPEAGVGAGPGPGCGAAHGLSETRYRPRCGGVVVVVVVVCRPEPPPLTSQCTCLCQCAQCPVAGSRSPFHPTLTPAGGLEWPGHTPPAPVVPICPACCLLLELQQYWHGSFLRLSLDLRSEMNAMKRSLFYRKNLARLYSKRNHRMDI